MNTGIKVQGQINEYKIKEININNQADIGLYLNAQSMYHVYPHLKGTSDYYELLNDMKLKKMDFLGPKSEVFDLLNRRITKKDLNGKDSVTIYVELPEQENYNEIRKIEIAPGQETVGRNKTIWTMTVDSGNLTTKNIYALLDYPQIQFTPRNMGMPDGTGGYEYEFAVSGGEYEDYILVSKLHAGARFHNIGAVRGEAAVNRGSVEMKLGGKAFVCYKYPLTKMGFAVNITDEAWRVGTKFVVKSEGSDDFKHKMGTFMFNDIDVKFKMESDMVFDRYLMIGRGHKPGENFLVDGTTHYEHILGPSFMDFFRGANSEIYYHQRFRVENILDRIRRQITKMTIQEREGLVVDVLTGDGGWDLLGPELEKMDKQGVIDTDWIYGTAPGLDAPRKGVILNRKQIRGLYLDNYGTVIFHNSELLNKGILSGQREVRKGFKLSSYWFIIMISKPNDPQNPINNAIHLYSNAVMEQYGAFVAEFTPTGPTLQAAANYKSASDISGRMYKMVNDLEKGIYVPNISGLHILYPDIYFKD